VGIERRSFVAGRPEVLDDLLDWARQSVAIRRRLRSSSATVERFDRVGEVDDTQPARVVAGVLAHRFDAGQRG
jgi:hypothetical protein